MDSIAQRQNIRLADLVLMAIADLNSLKLIAQPSTIHQHLESKEKVEKTWIYSSQSILNPSASIDGTTFESQYSDLA